MLFFLRSHVKSHVCVSYISPPPLSVYLGLSPRLYRAAAARPDHGLDQGCLSADLRHMSFIIICSSQRKVLMLLWPLQLLIAHTTCHLRILQSIFSGLCLEVFIQIFHLWFESLLNIGFVFSFFLICCYLDRPLWMAVVHCNWSFCCHWNPVLGTSLIPGSLPPMNIFTMRNNVFWASFGLLLITKLHSHLQTNLQKGSSGCADSNYTLEIWKPCAITRTSPSAVDNHGFCGRSNGHGNWLAQPLTEVEDNSDNRRRLFREHCQPSLQPLPVRQHHQCW